MFELLWVLVVLALPTMAAATWLLPAWPAATSGRAAAILGYGYVLGILGTAALLLALHRVTGTWQFGMTLGIVMLVGLAGAWVQRRRLLTELAELGAMPNRVRQTWHGATPLIRAAALILLGLLLVRLGSQFLEVIWRPVFAWDAWYHWTYRARVFFEAGHSDVFGHVQPWLRGEGPAYATHFRHGPLVSIIQLWPALALGQWHESLINLPWFLLGIAIALALYGQLRQAGVAALPALFAAYLLVSVPTFGLHATLAGYADLWMAAAVGLASMSLFLWMRDDRRRQIVPFLLALAAVPFLKQSGPIFAALFLPALLLGWLRPRYALVVVLAALAAGALVILTVGLEFSVPGLGQVIISRDQLVIPRSGELAFDPRWTFWAQRLFIDASWHLFALVMLVALAAGILQATSCRAHRALLVLHLGILAVLFFVFTATEQGIYLEDGSGFGRNFLPLLPSLLFLVSTFSIHSSRRTPE